MVLKECEASSLEAEIDALETTAEDIGLRSSSHSARYLWAVARHAFGIRDMRREWADFIHHAPVERSP